VKETCSSEYDKRLICSMSNLFEDDIINDGNVLRKNDIEDSIIFSYVGFTNSYYI